MEASLEILSTGVGLSLQDAGRPAWRRYGVPPGGAMDRYSMQCANELLGNRLDCPVLEILLQGAKIRVLKDTWVALTGANLGCEVQPWTACKVSRGTVLEFPLSRSGLFAYLGTPGGFVSEKWFGSASVDARNGLGRPLRKGDQLSGPESGALFSPERVKRRMLPLQRCRVFETKRAFKLIPGPQHKSFSSKALSSLTQAVWTVSARSDRTGFRLEGPAIEVPESIPSEPVLSGSFQIPGNGQPIITMVDGPTVGGYAKPAMLEESELDWLAQCAPGTQITFEWLK